MVKLATERLEIRQFEARDAEFVIELLNSDGWIRYIGDRNIHSEADALAYIERIQKPHVDGIGACLVERIEDGKKMGMTGVFVRDGLAFPDIGFAFLPQFEGKGYAFEATKAVLDWLSRTEKRTFQAITLPENTRSIQLLERLGFQKKEPIRLTDDAEELLLMQID